MNYTENDFAIMLLCAHLPALQEPVPLGVSEWGALAVFLVKRQSCPAHLLDPAFVQLLPQEIPATGGLTKSRIEALLLRDQALRQALADWDVQGISVVTRASKLYPVRLRKMLKHRSPPLFYLAGDPALLQAQAIGVSGSRDATAETLDWVRHFGEAAAGRGVTVVSGADIRTDFFGMLGALDAGGTAVCFPGDSLSRTTENPRLQPYIAGGKLAVLTVFAPQVSSPVHAARLQSVCRYAFAMQTCVPVCTEDAVAEDAAEAIRYDLCTVGVRGNDTPQCLALTGMGAKTLSDDPAAAVDELLKAGPPVRRIYPFGQALSDLKRAVGPQAEFRPGQWEAVDAVVNQRKRLLVVQRTGWGKSAVYFLTCLALRRATGQVAMIVSPLLALMRNQIEAAARFGLRAMKVDYTDADATDSVANALEEDRLDCLFVTPERFGNERFRETVLIPYMDKVGLLVIDEAHCISDWGHDFRPDYKRLQEIVRQVPKNAVILATTATANDRVVEDICTQLGNVAVSRGSLERSSLCLDTYVMPSATARWVWVDHALRELEGTGLIYTQTIRETVQLAQWLSSRGHLAQAYSGELNNRAREQLEGRLQRNELKVLVTTSALGMGYDKPDLRFVIHMEAPTSIIAYYQQVGRAGRAVDKAYGILLHHPSDEEVLRYFWKTAIPPAELMSAVAHEVQQSPGAVKVSDLEPKINAKRSRIQAALTHLSMLVPAPVVRDSDGWQATGYPYNPDQDYIDRLYQLREREWQQMLAYIRTPDCKMDFLRRALNDAGTTACGRCSSCRGKSFFEIELPEDEIRAVQSYLKDQITRIRLPQRIPRGALAGMGFAGILPPREAVVLSRWMDEGWGTLVAQGKNGNRFGDELVEASVSVLTRACGGRLPFDAVCCITSLRRPVLVPDFAVRLAARLGLPFTDAVHKVLDTPPQKTLENTFHQVNNLDLAFAVDREKIAGKKLLLVDDALDSGWTLALVSQQLSLAGAEAVFPFALTTTNNRS